MGTEYGRGIGFSTLIGKLFVSDAMTYKSRCLTPWFSAAVTFVGIAAATLGAQRVFRLEPGVVFKA